MLCAVAAFVYLPTQLRRVHGRRSRARHVRRRRLGNPALIASIAVVIGIVLAAVILSLTGYFTGTEHKPAKDVGQDLADRRGHRHPVRHLGRLRVGRLHRAGHRRRGLRAALLGGASLIISLFAIALAGCGLLTTVGVIVAMDTFGPVSDNAQGIAEMSGDVSRGGRPDPHRARRRRQHHQGHHQGHRDRHRRAGRDRAVRLLRHLGDRQARVVRPEVRRDTAAAQLRRVQPAGPGRHAARRGRGVPVLRPGDQRGGPGGRRGGLRGPPPVPGDPRDHGGHRPAGVRQGRRHRHPGLAARAGHPGPAGGARADRRRLRPRRRRRWPASWPARSPPAP